MPKVSLSQEGLHLYMTLSEEVISKMNERRKAEPGKWDGRDFDLLDEVDPRPKKKAESRTSAPEK